MSILHLLDHGATLWRPQVALGDLKQAVTTYVEVGTLRVGVRRRRAPLADPGPGLTPTGSRVVYAMPEVDVRNRDVFQLTSGPESGERLEVDDHNRPRGHHLEAECRLWAGRLPVDEVAS